LYILIFRYFDMRREDKNFGLNKNKHFPNLIYFWLERFSDQIKYVGGTYIRGAWGLVPLRQWDTGTAVSKPAWHMDVCGSRGRAARRRSAVQDVLKNDMKQKTSTP
jgi:hypothetical protein